MKQSGVICENYKTCPAAGKFDNSCDGNVTYNELNGYSTGVRGNTGKRIKCLYLENSTQNRRQTKLLELIADKFGADFL